MVPAPPQKFLGYKIFFAVLFKLFCRIFSHLATVPGTTAPQSCCDPTHLDNRVDVDFSDISMTTCRRELEQIPPTNSKIFNPLVAFTKTGIHSSVGQPILTDKQTVKLKTDLLQNKNKNISFYKTQRFI